MPSDLELHQWRFSEMVAQLLTHAVAQGYRVSLGEAYRTPQQAAVDAAKGIGIAHSLHTERLAIDLMLFDGDGNYLADTTHYQALGEWWEGIGGAWGGRFTPRADGDHFSLEYQGIK